jgi:peptidoglycan/LPS O-acetylase OafA/YrhL
MSWQLIIIAFVGGAIAAAGIAKVRGKEGGGSLKRILVAASALPLATMCLTLVVVIWAQATLSNSGESNRTVTTMLVIGLGLVIAVASFFGGLIAAALTALRNRNW